MNNYKFNDIELRPEYQQPIHDATIEHCKQSNEPAFVSASVGAGKTVNIGAIAGHVQNAGGRVLIVARTGELVSQNSKMAWKMGVKNSTYSASLNSKSTFYPVVFASEKTLAGGLESDFIDKPYNVLIVDECLTGESLISTENGLMRIDDQDLVDTRVLCIDEDSGELVLDYPVRVFSNGIRNISRLKTKSSELRCTDTHRIYSKNTWVKVKDLKVGQNIELNGSQDFVMRKLLRAVAAVVKKLCQLTLTRIIQKVRV